MKKYKTQILALTASILFWLLCYSCTAQAQTQTKKVLPSLDSLPYLTTDTALNNFMLHWLGKPYKLGGTTERGIDCSGFNKRLYTDVYKLNLENVCYKQWAQTNRVPKDSLQTGDLLFFRSRQSPSGWHCAVYLGETMFVHAANRYEGVKISSMAEPNYKRAFRGAGRLINNK
jgi:cell wall-associated NlpC family hydrolase